MSSDSHKIANFRNFHKIPTNESFCVAFLWPRINNTYFRKKKKLSSHSILHRQRCDGHQKKKHTLITSH